MRCKSSPVVTQWTSCHPASPVLAVGRATGRTCQSVNIDFVLSGAGIAPCTGGFPHSPILSAASVEL